RAQVKVHEQALRELKDIRIERIIKNHAQLLALVDCLKLIIPLTDRQHAGAQRELVAMALARQTAVNADPAEVAEFWEAFDYLQGLSEDPVVDHSKKSDVIAVNLNEFCERAAEHRQKIADIGTLRTLLPNSRSRKYLTHNKGVDSAVRAAFNRRNQCSQRGTTVKCWLFQNPDPTGRGNA
ncbi:bifunctional DNA primase/helicase, partial [Stutzerimonas stutzeri]